VGTSGPLHKSYDSKWQAAETFEPSNKLGQ